MRQQGLTFSLAVRVSTFNLCSLPLLSYYLDATFFFSVAGASEPFIDTIILQTISVSMALCSLPLTRRFGRRHLLLTGFSISTIAMFIIAIVSTASPATKSSGRLLVAMSCILLGGYSATIGPLSWVTAGEMASTHLRSHTFGVGMAIGFFFAWLTTFTTPFFINTTALNLGGKGLSLGTYLLFSLY